MKCLCTLQPAEKPPKEQQGSPRETQLGNQSRSTSPRTRMRHIVKRHSSGSPPAPVPSPSPPTVRETEAQKASQKQERQGEVISLSCSFVFLMIWFQSFFGNISVLPSQCWASFMVPRQSIPRKIFWACDVFGSIWIKTTFIPCRSWLSSTLDLSQHYKACDGWNGVIVACLLCAYINMFSFVHHRTPSQSYLRQLFQGHPPTEPEKTTTEIRVEPEMLR